MSARTFIEGRPVYRQLKGTDPLSRGAAAKSGRSARLDPRTLSADKVVKSVCPYCAIGCGQNVYVEEQKVTQIEGDPDSPVSRGRLCPKGSASLQLTTGEARQYQVLYRRAHGTDWEPLDLDTAMDMIADRVIRLGCLPRRPRLRRRPEVHRRPAAGPAPPPRSSQRRAVLGPGSVYRRTDQVSTPWNG